MENHKYIFVFVVTIDYILRTLMFQKFCQSSDTIHLTEVTVKGFHLTLHHKIVF